MARRQFILPVIILFLTQGLMQSCTTNTILFVLATQHATTLSGISPELSGVGSGTYQPILITKADDVIDSHFYHCDPDKVLGVVITDTPLYLSPMWYPLTAEAAPEEVKQIARNYVDFLLKEVKEGRMPEQLPPIQTGGGMVAGTVLREMGKHFKGMEMYTEAVLEDAVAMVREGSMDFISTAGFGCSGETTADILNHPDEYEGKLMIRPVEISNHPEVIRRLGLITMNNIVEADIYGNINSSHVNGTNVISGIGGALDFAQNVGLPSYFTLSADQTMHIHLLYWRSWETGISEPAITVQCSPKCHSTCICSKSRLNKQFHRLVEVNKTMYIVLESRL